MVNYSFSNNPALLPNNLPLLSNNPALLPNNLPLLSNNPALLPNNLPLLSNNPPLSKNNLPFYGVIGGLVFLRCVLKLFTTGRKNI